MSSHDSLKSTIFLVPTIHMNIISMRYGGVKMGAVHECGQRYIHVYVCLTPRRTGVGRVGSLVIK